MTDRTFSPGDRVHLKHGTNKHGAEPFAEDGRGEVAVFEVLEIKAQYEHEIEVGRLPWVVIRGLAAPNDFEQVVHGGRLVPVEGN